MFPPLTYLFKIKCLPVLQLGPALVGKSQHLVVISINPGISFYDTLEFYNFFFQRQVKKDLLWDLQRQKFCSFIKIRVFKKKISKFLIIWLFPLIVKKITHKCHTEKTKCVIKSFGKVYLIFELSKGKCSVMFIFFLHLWPVYLNFHLS